MKHKYLIRVICTLIISILNYGCAVGIKDYSTEPKYQYLQNACLETKKSAFLYEARCADLETGGLGGSTFCKGIQGFDPLPQVGKHHTNLYNYPKSWKDYLSDREKWDKSLFKKLFFEKQRSMIAKLELGTKLLISGIYGYPRGETGHVLLVKAKIVNGQFKGTIVELKSRMGFSDHGPHWIIETYSPDVKVEYTNEYLQKCQY